MLCQTAACDPNLPGANAIATPGQLQQMRTADANLRTEANRMAAESNGTVVTSFGYSQGPDGRNYISSVTVTSTERVPTSELVNSSSAPNTPQFDPQSLADLSPIALSPLAIAEALAADQQINQAGNGAAIRELQQADAGVRTHEGLHFRAAGGVASGLPQFEYAEGPDGKLYAVAGEVRVQTTATNDPNKAARDSQAFAAAAIAPADASAADLAGAKTAISAANGASSAVNSSNVPTRNPYAEQAAPLKPSADYAPVNFYA